MTNSLISTLQTVVDALTLTYIEAASLPRTFTSPPNLVPMRARPQGFSVPEGVLSFEAISFNRW